MDIDQLRTFLTILEHGTFSRAAQALHITQSTVSFRIQALETRIGSRLLDRHGTRVRPTSAGRVLQRYAAQTIALVDEAMSQLRAEESGEHGRVVIAASTIPAEYLLPSVLTRFRAAHPNVAVRVEVQDSGRSIASLGARACDLALVGGVTKDRRIVFTPFAEDEVVLVGPYPNRFAPRGHLGPAELSRVPLLFREPSSGTRQAAAKVLSKDGMVLEGRGDSIEIGSTEAIKRCVRAGLGLAFLSKLAVAEDVLARRLSLVRFPGVPARRSFYVARSKSATLSAAAKALVVMILETREHREPHRK